MHKEKKDKNFIKKPIYPGGVAAMRNFIRQNLVYPSAALQNKIEGTVSLKYTIDHKGMVIGTHIISGLGYGCDEEAERIVKLFKFDVPRTRGVKVQFHKDIHVHFRLPKKKEMPKQQAMQIVYTTPAVSNTPSTSPKQENKGYQYTITITRKKGS